MADRFPDENDLRAMLRGNDRGQTAVDLGAVLRRSSRRRLAKTVLLRSAVGCAIIAIGLGGALGIRSGLSATATRSMSSGSSGTTSHTAAASPGTLLNPGSSPGQQSMLAPTRCGDPVSIGIPSTFTGIVISATYDQRPAEGNDTAASPPEISGKVVLTNTSGHSFAGTASAQPVITLSRDNVSLWQTPLTDVPPTRALDLGPGESLTYPVTFRAVQCTSGNGWEGGSSTGNTKNEQNPSVNPSAGPSAGLSAGI